MTTHIMSRFRIAVAGIFVACLVLPLAARAGDGCRYPFVWREAFPGDHVCVVPGTRTQAARDNAVADQRVNLTNHDYGPDTCVGGFVWREARRSDHVCVRPEIRTQAANDNAAAPYRYANSGSRLGIRGGGDSGCCPQSMLVCPLGRHFCQ